jgi:hypothetical protein
MLGAAYSHVRDPHNRWARVSDVKLIWVSTNATCDFSEATIIALWFA